MKREYFLDEAKKCVCGGRDKDYGEPEDSFKLIASLWTAYMGDYYSPKDVALMLALLKIARGKTSDKADNFTDLAGYAACAGEIATKDKQEKQKPNCELY